MARNAVAVLGSGNGGQATAALLARAGHRVKLFGRYGFERNLLPIRERGGIQFSGVAGSGEVALEKVTSDISEAMDEAQLVVVATPATTHEELAAITAPHFSDGQLLLIMQGAAASVIFARAIAADKTRQVSIGETSTLPYTCRIIGPAHVHISRISRRQLFAAFPGREGQVLAERLHLFFPFLVPATHILETALYNPNPILHPPATILNLGRIEHVTGEFRIYQEGFTKSIWTLIRALDAEKIALLQALDLPAMPYLEEFAWRNSDTFEEFASLGIKGPSGSGDRYITEDVPIGLVLFASVGALLKVSTAVCDALIDLASVINATDYRLTGRTLERLHLGGLQSSDLITRLIDGAPRQSESTTRSPGGQGRRIASDETGLGQG